MLEANNSYKVTAIDIMSLLRSDSDGNVTIDFDNGKQVKGQLRIPEYQRPYVWKPDDILKFLEKLHKEYFSLYDELPSYCYYLGTLVFYQERGSSFIEIIDGQQRLTTVALLLAFLRDANLSFPIRYSHPKSQKSIINNYDWMESNKEKLENIDFEKISVTIVITSNQDDAYRFFENQNTAGVRLNALQILKPLHLQAVEPMLMDEYAKKWEEIDGDLSEVARYLLKARLWRSFNFREIPKDQGSEKYRDLLISEFGEKTSTGDNVAYTLSKISHGKNSIDINFSKNAYHVCQPLNKGVNAIEYFFYFVGLYKDFLKNYNVSSNNFYKWVCSYRDGTGLLIEFYQICLLIYLSIHGVKEFKSASFWLFRSTFELRFRHKVVKQDTIKNFIEKEKNIFDYIYASFSSGDLFHRLEQLEYKNVKIEDDTQKGVRYKFLGRVLGRMNENENNFSCQDEVICYDVGIKKYIKYEVGNDK